MPVESAVAESAGRFDDRAGLAPLRDGRLGERDGDRRRSGVLGRFPERGTLGIAAARAPAKDDLDLLAADRLARKEDDGALDDVAQLADVARPVVAR